MSSRSTDFANNLTVDAGAHFPAAKRQLMATYIL